MSIQRILPIIAATSLVALALAPGAAIARQHTIYGNAPGNCQSTRSDYLASYRVRAQSVDNEGSGAIWVACAPGTLFDVSGAIDLHMGVRNTSSSPVTVNCTVVSGLSSGITTYFAKSVTLAANSESEIVWDAIVDNGNQYIQLPASFVCALPPSAGLTTNKITYWTPDA